MVVGENTITFPVGIFFEGNTPFFAEIQSPNNISLLGQTLIIDGNQETVPYGVFTGRLAMKTNIATEAYVNNAVNPVIPTSGTITSLSIDGQSTGVNTGFTISGSQTFRFSVNNPSLFAGNLTLLQGSTALSTTINPTATSIAVTVTSTTLANIGDSVTFTLVGMNTDGQSVHRDYRIHVVGSSELVYYGTSSLNNPGTLDLSTLESHIVGTGNLEVSTGTITEDDYFIILVPNANLIHSITDRIGNPVSLTAFTRTDSVRVINTVSYTSYSTGPLNASAEPETYTLTLR
ncbi:MAG: hypothetical protein K0U41_04495 [Gammaproteobacteria bacterium]|nr:hypothetical protein [Gammaproteobacteria bacterium]